MKAVGIVRRVDALNRITIPQELSRAMKLSKGDAVEFFTDGENLTIRKYDTLGDLEQILDNTEKASGFRADLCRRQHARCWTKSRKCGPFWTRSSRSKAVTGCDHQ